MHLSQPATERRRAATSFKASPSERRSRRSVRGGAMSRMPAYRTIAVVWHRHRCHCKGKERSTACTFGQMATMCGKLYSRLQRSDMHGQYILVDTVCRCTQPAYTISRWGAVRQCTTCIYLCLSEDPCSRLDEQESRVQTRSAPAGARHSRQLPCVIPRCVLPFVQPLSLSLPARVVHRTSRRRRLLVSVRSLFALLIRCEAPAPANGN